MQARDSSTPWTHWPFLLDTRVEFYGFVWNCWRTSLSMSRTPTGNLLLLNLDYNWELFSEQNAWSCSTFVQLHLIDLISRVCYVIICVFSVCDVVDLLFDVLGLALCHFNVDSDFAFISFRSWSLDVDDLSCQVSIGLFNLGTFSV